MGQFFRSVLPTLLYSHKEDSYLGHLPKLCGFCYYSRFQPFVYLAKPASTAVFPCLAIEAQGGHYLGMAWSWPKVIGILFNYVLSHPKPRGQGTGNLQGDEALLQAICGCNTSAKGRAKLYIFTERSEPKSGSGWVDLSVTIATASAESFQCWNCRVGHMGCCAL